MERYCLQHGPERQPADKYCLRVRCALILAAAFVILASACNVNAQDISGFKNAKPFSVSGGMSVTGIGYTASGIPYRRQPFTYLFSGDPTFTFYNFSIPVSFTLSQAGNTYSQPFNQFGINPSYKWITVHAGYSSVDFSPYTLGGHTMLGAGIELTPGKLRFGFMYGRLNRATTIDTATDALVPYSFSRRGYAIKLGYGTERNHFDLSYLSAKDDSDSVPQQFGGRYNTLTPARNDVIGYDARFSFMKVFVFETDGAISLYTNDINSTLTLDSISSPLLKKLKGLFGINATSECHTAFSAALGYRSRNYGLKVSYKRIDPNFQTMGAYYFDSDFENWTIVPSASLLKGKIRFNGNIGIQHDDLQNQKRARNQRFIANVNNSFELSKSLGMDMVYTNFSDNQQARAAIFADSLRIVQTTQTLGLMPRYLIVAQNMVHAISASLNYSVLNDYNDYLGADAVARGLKTRQYFVNYNLTLPKKSLSFFTNFNHTALNGDGISNVFDGFTIGSSAGFAKQKLQTSLSASFTQSKASQQPSAFIVNTTGTVRYQVFKKQFAALSLFFTDNKTKVFNPLEPSFTESRAELSYQVNF